MRTFNTIEEFFESDYTKDQTNRSHKTNVVKNDHAWFWKDVIIGGIRVCPLSIKEGEWTIFTLCFEPENKQQFKKFLEFQKKYDFCVLG